MKPGRSVLALFVALAAAACGESAPPAERSGGGAGAPSATPADQEPPVALNPDSPIQYPPKLYDQKVEGDVVLRLFVDSTGRLAAESSKVAESSGYPALDSAALAGARKLRFAPARRHGVPWASAFLQPIVFRHPGSGASVMKGRPDTTGTTSTGARPGASRRTRARRDTTAVRPDTAAAIPDSGAVQVDTTAAKGDTSAVAR